MTRPQRIDDHRSRAALRAKRLSDFDPSAAAAHLGIFGLPFPPHESEIIIIPAPYEATTSYGNGTSMAPEAILKASYQVDLFERASQDHRVRTHGSSPHEAW